MQILVWARVGCVCVINLFNLYNFYTLIFFFFFCGGGGERVFIKACRLWICPWCSHVGTSLEPIWCGMCYTDVWCEVWFF